MDAPTAETSSLHVDRFRAQYLVASDHPAPEGVKLKLDATLQKTLPDALRNALSGWFSDGDSSIWFLRELGIDLDLNLGWDVERVARTWATQLARELSEGLNEDESHGVVRFPDRAAYLASFLSDLANGSAWGKWYYKRFDGLRMLPSSAALRTVICGEAEYGSTALLRLKPTDLENVLGALMTQDARRVLEHLAANEPPVEESRCFGALWKAWPRIDPGLVTDAGEVGFAVRLYLEAHRIEGVSGPTLKTSALALIRLARRLRERREPGNEGLFDALVTGDVTNLNAATGSRDAEVLFPLIRCEPSVVKQIWNGLAQSAVMSAGPAESGSEPTHTPFGGMFLLLPLLDRLPLERWTENWPNPSERQNACGLMRFLILVKCCGGERASRAFFDPLLRDLLRLDPGVTPAVVAQWQARVPRKKLEAFLHELASWERENGCASGSRLALARVRYRRASIALLIDTDRGCWLTATRYSARQPARFVNWLERWLSADTESRKLFIVDPRFADLLRRVSSPVEAIQLDAAQEEDEEVIKAVSCCLSKVSEDLVYLASAGDLHFRPAFDLTCGIAAQAMLRNLAWKLPGFSRSGLAYLYRNFLDFSGSLEAEAERYVVRLGRPPLNIILAMAGLQRARYQLKWLEDDRPFTLFQYE